MVDTTNIYILVDPRNNKKAYVGKADDVKDRYKGHKDEVACGGQTKKCRWLRKLNKLGLEPIVMVLDSSVPKDDWESNEKFWIRFFRLGGWCLTNATDGGEGRNGWIATEEYRKECSERRKEQLKNPKIYHTAVKTLSNREVQLRSKESQRTSEYREQNSKSHREMWADPEYRAVQLKSRLKTAPNAIRARWAQRDFGVWLFNLEKKVMKLTSSRFFESPFVKSYKTKGKEGILISLMVVHVRRNFKLWLERLENHNYM